MANFQVPHEFVPESGQTIASQEVDENFQAVAQQLDDINTALGTQSGTFTDARKVLYTNRPAYTGSSAPASNELIDRKYLEATRGCRVGDIILSVNPNAMPNDYGVVWAKMEGQQLAAATYPEFNTLCTTIGGTETGRYNPTLGATTGNFVAPDWRGGIPMQILAGGSALTSKVPNFVAANWLGSVVGESAHKQSTTEVGSHTHPLGFKPSAAGGGGGGTVESTTPSTSTTAVQANQADAAVQAMNIVQQCFIALVWMRIK